MDPSGGGIASAAKELMEEMLKASQEAQKKGKGGLGGSNRGEAGKFAETLKAKQVEKSTKVEGLQGLRKSSRVQQTLRTNNIKKIQPNTKVGAAARAQRNRVADMLQGLINGQDQMNKVMNIATSGAQMSPHDLLTMQANIYRFTIEMELAGKVVEKGTGGINKIINTQVGG